MKSERRQARRVIDPPEGGERSESEPPDVTPRAGESGCGRGGPATARQDGDEGGAEQMFSVALFAAAAFEGDGDGAGLGEECRRDVLRFAVTPGGGTARLAFLRIGKATRRVSDRTRTGKAVPTLQ